jgi:hypothetical protein
MVDDADKRVFAIFRGVLQGGMGIRMRRRC